MPHGPWGECERGAAHMPLPQSGADAGRDLRQHDGDAARWRGHGECLGLSCFLISKAQLKPGAFPNNLIRAYVLVLTELLLHC